MKHFINIALLLFFTTLVVTGVLAFAMPFSLVTTRVHMVFGFGTAVLVGLHLSSRLSYFRRALGPGRGGKRLVPVWTPGAVVGIWALVLTAALWDWTPVERFVGLSYESRHRAAIFRPDPKTQYQALGDEMRLRREADGDASLLVELDWGEAFPGPYEGGARPFQEGRPQIAIWAESDRGSLIETFYVSEQAAFAEQFEWDGHALDRVDVLPVWRHRYTLKTGVEPDGEVAAYSGATPEHAFSVHRNLQTDGDPFYLYIEINVPGDTNDYFHPDQPEDEPGYVKPGLGQPSVIYGAYLEPEEEGRYALLDLIAHGGSTATRDGNMHYDLEHLTTARQLIEKVLVRVELAEPPDEGEGSQAEEGEPEAGDEEAAS